MILVGAYWKSFSLSPNLPMQSISGNVTARWRDPKIQRRQKRKIGTRQNPTDLLAALLSRHLQTSSCYRIRMKDNALPRKFYNNDDEGNLTLEGIWWKSTGRKRDGVARKWFRNNAPEISNVCARSIARSDNAWRISISREKERERDREGDRVARLKPRKTATANGNI